MDPTLTAVLETAIRWLHIASVVVLIGAYFYTASTKTVFPPGFRSTLWIVMFTILASGAYQFLTKASYPKHYHMWFGIKMLLVLHIFTVTFLLNISNTDAAKFQRRAFVASITGFLTIAVANYLRWLSVGQ